MPESSIKARAELKNAEKQFEVTGDAPALSRNLPKRCRWQIKRGKFEEVPRLAGAKRTGIGWDDGEQERRDWRDRQGSGNRNAATVFADQIDGRTKQPY